jgi:site-specific DNA recombinase
MQFNSIDAQREAAENFIASQRHEGWLCLPERFDDGGFTGSNMNRPALARLLQEIESARVDCVVVYKIDRLSRSLLDFMRLMEVFTSHDVAFVSVTGTRIEMRTSTRISERARFSFERSPSEAF